MRILNHIAKDLAGALKEVHVYNVHHGMNLS